MVLLDLGQFPDKLNFEERGESAERQERVVRIVVEVDGRDAPETFQPNKLGCCLLEKKILCGSNAL
jgi:hypothetical protein